jgi:Putative binding domain, N-terminal
MRPAIVVACVLLIFGSPVSAQTANNPKFVQFVPSADHDAVVAGVAVVTRYDLRFYHVESPTVLLAVNLGKPTPGQDGTILLDWSVLTTYPLADGVYQARAVAVGPSGEGVSDLSNTFAFSTVTQGCTYTLPSNTWTVAIGGGQTTASLVASTGTCAWTATSSAGWATITPSSGTGSTSGLSITAAANTGAARVATLVIAGLTYTIVQDGTGGIGGDLPHPVTNVIIRFGL